MAEAEKKCRAKIVLGPQIKGVWVRCSLRMNGLCCCYCDKKDSCENPCSFSRDKYSNKVAKETDCMYFLTEVEAVVKRLATDEERGVRR